MKKLLTGRKKFLTIPLALLAGLFFLPITILLVLGWLVYAKISHQKVRFASLSIIGLLILFFGTAYISAIVNPSPPKEIEQVEETTQSEPKSTPTPSVEEQQNEATPTLSSNLQQVRVTRVIDGDTIVLEAGEVVRYIGMDTPETVHPSKPVQCYGKEASAKNRELVEGKEVRLEKDVSETDKYGRLLRYIWLGDTLVNELLVREGYARSSTYPPDVKYQNRFIEAERQARQEGKGLWGDTCNTSTPTPTTPPSQTTPSSPPVIDDKCDCSKTCPQMSSCEEAQYQLNVCGCTARDRDKDGIACDAQCQ